MPDIFSCWVNMVVSISTCKTYFESEGYRVIIICISICILFQTQFKSGNIMQFTSRSSNKALQMVMDPAGRLVVDGCGPEGPEHQHSRLNLILKQILLIKYWTWGVPNCYNWECPPTKIIPLFRLIMFVETINHKVFHIIMERWNHQTIFLGKNC